MHEMAIVTEIADAVIEAARGAEAQTVRTVYLTIGQGRDVVPEIFEGMWAHYTRGTMAQDSILDIDCPPLMARCQRCGALFPLDLAEQQARPCPACSAQDYALHSGMEFTIDRIEVM